MIKATIIADSKNTSGQRITSFVCTFPRIILAEINTHRMLSRNSASSRAIPFEKMLERVENDPFIPIKWMKDHSGMQGNEYMDERDAEVAKSAWLMAKIRAVEQAKYLSERGLTKQIVNRLLEPFMWHKAIITGTEFGNFFALRAHEAAEIHLQDLAYKMLDAMNNSTPQLLEPGQWHIPFGDKMDEQRISHLVSKEWNGNGLPPSAITEKIKIKIATARCARVSYMNFDGKDDYEADIKLHDRLLSSGHMSPFEHCAKADTPGMSRWGNFFGFIQYRKLLEGENKSDNRLKK